MDLKPVYLLTGSTAEAVQKMAGFKVVAPLLSGAFWLELPDQWDPKSPWHDLRVRQAVSHAIPFPVAPVALVDGAFATVREAAKRASPCLLEPLMAVEVVCPTEFMGTVVGDLTLDARLLRACDFVGALLHLLVGLRVNVGQEIEDLFLRELAEQALRHDRDRRFLSLFDIDWAELDFVDFIFPA